MKREMMKHVAAAALACGLASQATAKDIATVNGKGISAKEFLSEVESMGPQAEMLRTQPQTRIRFVNQLITVRLLADAGQKAGVGKSKDFASRLKSLERQVLAQMYVEKFVKDNTGEKQQKEYFNKNKDKFSNKEVCAAHILLKEADKKKAEDVLKKSKAKGADFAALAKEHSTGPSGPKGGDLGCFGKGRMVPEFEKAAFSTKKGTVHPSLVKTQFGFHIIKVSDVKGGDKVKFADVKDRVVRELENDIRRDLFDNVKKEAKIKIHEDVLTKLKM